MLRLCISREFRLFAPDRSSPVVDWLRGLARHAHRERGGPGVGVVGLCLTCNFALSMMTEPTVVAYAVNVGAAALATSETLGVRLSAKARPGAPRRERGGRH